MKTKLLRRMRQDFHVQPAIIPLIRPPGEPYEDGPGFAVITYKDGRIKYIEELAGVIDHILHQMRNASMWNTYHDLLKEHARRCRLRANVEAGLLEASIYKHLKNKI